MVERSVLPSTRWKRTSICFSRGRKLAIADDSQFWGRSAIIGVPVAIWQTSRVVIAPRTASTTPGACHWTCRELNPVARLVRRGYHLARPRPRFCLKSRLALAGVRLANLAARQDSTLSPRPTAIASDGAPYSSHGVLLCQVPATASILTIASSLSTVSRIKISSI